MDPSQLNHIYKTVAEDKIPWIRNQIPDCLLNTIERYEITSCKIVDLGCGTGSYSLCLAKLGFEVFGIDFSDVAIEKAKQSFNRKGVKGEFMALDLSQELDHKLPFFDFAFDYEVLHHIFPEDRIQYLKNVANLLVDNGKYLSVFFSEEDESFGGIGKYRKTPLNTTLYFSHQNEVKALVSPLFDILDIKTIEIHGKPHSHKAIYCLMQKKSTS